MKGRSKYKTAKAIQKNLGDCRNIDCDDDNCPFDNNGICIFSFGDSSANVLKYTNRWLESEAKKTSTAV